MESIIFEYFIEFGAFIFIVTKLFNLFVMKSIRRILGLK